MIEAGFHSNKIRKKSYFFNNYISDIWHNILVKKGKRRGCSTQQIFFFTLYHLKILRNPTLNLASIGHITWPHFDFHQEIEIFTFTFMIRMVTNLTRNLIYEREDRHYIHPPSISVMIFCDSFRRTFLPCCLQSLEVSSKYSNYYKIKLELFWQIRHFLID